jgi:uncharacterized membrane protein YkoI
MRRTRTLAIALAAGVLAVAGGAGIAQAVSGSDDEPVTGPAAERAADAALAAAGGGTVREVERQDGDGAGVYEVEVRREDGSEVEIHLDAQFREVGSAVDDGDAEAENDGSDD